MRAWLAIVVGCAGNPATTERATNRSGSAEHVSGSASDPGEPTAPEVECNFERRVRCVQAFDNEKPYQAPPFVGCPRTLPRDVKDPMFPDAQSQFSAAETRSAWRTTPGVCCYVDFIARQCR